MSQRRKLLILVAVFLAIAIAAAVILCRWSVPDSPGAVASEFVRVSVSANVDRAKALAEPDLWDQIEEAIESREPFRCRSYSWDSTGVGGSGWRPFDGNEWSFGMVYQCASQATPYCLLIRDIIVRETEGGFRVAEWGEVCEAEDYGYVCSELCPP
jgi:hypothetical protein